MKNLLQDLTRDSLTAAGFAWENPPATWEPLPAGAIRVTAPARSDFFRDPAGRHVSDNAPFLYASITGDFVARGHVRPDFQSTYDSGVLMVRHDAQHWAKLCFEKTDFGTTAAVSVVTRGFSDDANGVDLAVPDLWLQMMRVGSVFGLHYSLDGQAWRMVRLFHLDAPAAVRVGLAAQSPAGPGTTVDFLSFSVEERTPQNIRSGEA